MEIKPNEKILIYSAIFGVIAFISGAIGFYIRFGGGENTQWRGSYGIVMSEMFITLSFILLTMILLWAAARWNHVRSGMLIAGVSRLALLLILFFVFYKEDYSNWYYILDPIKNDVSAYFVVIFGGLQGIALFFARKQ